MNEDQCGNAKSHDIRANLPVEASTEWEERENFAAIKVVLSIQGEKISEQYLATVSTSARAIVDLHRFERRKESLRDLFDGRITWKRYGEQWY